VQTEPMLRPACLNIGLQLLVPSLVMHDFKGAVSPGTWDFVSGDTESSHFLTSLVITGLHIHICRVQ